jgi:hypothetical protein
MSGPDFIEVENNTIHLPNFNPALTSSYNNGEVRPGTIRIGSRIDANIYGK